MAKRPRRTNQRQEREMAGALDRMTRFKEFEENILPELQRDISKGMSTKEMANKYSRFAMARLITEALTSTNSALAKGAAKDIVEFGDGKATERKEVSHRMEKLPQEQLDALLLTELSEVEDEPSNEES
jgi:hypothetical protein